MIKLLKVWLEIDEQHRGYFLCADRFGIRCEEVTDPKVYLRFSRLMTGPGTRQRPTYWYVNLRPDGSLVWGDQAPEQNW